MCVVVGIGVSMHILYILDAVCDRQFLLRPDHLWVVRIHNQSAYEHRVQQHSYNNTYSSC